MFEFKFLIHLVNKQSSAMLDLFKVLCETMTSQGPNPMGECSGQVYCAQYDHEYGITPWEKHQKKSRGKKRKKEVIVNEFKCLYPCIFG